MSALYSQSPRGGIAVHRRPSVPGTRGPAGEALVESLRGAAINAVLRARRCLAYRKGWHAGESEEADAAMVSLRADVEALGLAGSPCVAAMCTREECRATVAAARVAVAAWRAATGNG